MINMRGSWSPYVVAAEVKMRRTQHKGAFLVVEGRSDWVFWKTRRHKSCQLVNAEGKHNVVKGIQRLDEEDISGALGVVDSNHDYLAGTDPISTNLVATDAHDMECLLCRSSALDKVLAEHGDPDKITRFEKNHGTDVRTGLLERALVFGQLRWAAQVDEPKIGLAEIRIPRFVDETTWSVDAAGLIRTVAQESSNDAVVLEERMAQLPSADPWYVANGHDMVEILRLGLRKVLGRISSTIGQDRIAELLRAGTTPSDLQSTGLWRDMRAWEGENVPYLVLAD